MVVVTVMVGVLAVSPNLPCVEVLEEQEAQELLERPGVGALFRYTIKTDNKDAS